MSDTSSGSPRSNAKSSAKPGAKAPAEKNAGRGDVLAAEGVLANLPRTRPQRSSARRDAAREHDAARRQATTKKQSAKAKATVKAMPKKAKAASKRVQDRVPRQGFETEGDPVSGPVQPPGSVDLLSSAAELAGELAKSGLSSGGRLLKDFIARLPLN
jgi:hypothetical protein